jgi:aspartyl-tRNA synthetase
MRRSRISEPDRDLDGRAVGDLVVRHGGPVANGLLDPRCALFRSPEVEGVVGYRDSWGCAVALGDPVCNIRDMPRLAARFREHCAARGQDTAYAAGSETIAAIVCGWGGAAVQFGETLTFDPRLDPQSGARGRELRKKVRRARREGVVVQEYRPERAAREPAPEPEPEEPEPEPEPEIERALEEVVARWLAARHGFQLYMTRVRLFRPRVAGRRWFYARAGSRMLGVLSLLRLETRRGYLMEHLLAAPGSPVGVTELLVTDCFAALKAEGCTFAAFGPAPSAELGRVQNLGSVSEAFARFVFSTSSRLFHLDGRRRFQRKFQVASAEPVYLVFDPPRVGPLDVMALMRAFNLSLR